LSPTPLKNDGVRQWDDDIPNGMESQKIQGSSQHQPDIISYAQPYSNLGVSWSGVDPPDWRSPIVIDQHFLLMPTSASPKGPLGPKWSTHLGTPLVTFISSCDL
jgi:hypothetical protein